MVRVKSIQDLKKAQFDKVIITRVDSEELGLKRLLQNEIPRERIVLLGE